MASEKLTASEKLFCEYFVYGDTTYQWKADNCYKKCILGIEPFNMDYQKDPKKMGTVLLESNKLKNRADIQAYIKQLLTEGKDDDIEAMILREMSITTLQNIALECSQTMVENEDGEEYVPASARQAAIKAIDTLTKIKPSIKEKEDGADGVGQATIQFVVQPTQANDYETE